MKFTTTTTSSLLLASMALSSPSLSVAAPTGMEVPTSPNPAGTPSIRQFPPSPLFDGPVGHSPRNTRAPAFRTGPGSPRRSIPSRMVKVSKRQDAQNTPNAGLLSNIVDPIINTLTNTFSGVPIIGGLLGNGGTREKAASATVASLPNVEHVTDSLSGLPVLGGVTHLVNGSPSGSVSNTISGLGLSLPASVGDVPSELGGLPPFSNSNAFSGVDGPLGLVGGVVSGVSPPQGSVTHPNQENQREPRIIPLPNGGYLISDNGVWKEVPRVFAAASAPVSAAAGPQPSAGASTHPDHPDLASTPIPGLEHHAQKEPAALAVDDGKPSSLPGLSVNPPSPSVSPPVSKVLVHPATPTGTPAPPNTPTQDNPPVSSSTVHAVSHIAITPVGPTTPVAAASVPGDVFDDIPGDLPGDLDDLVPGLIHGMSAP